MAYIECGRNRKKGLGPCRRPAGWGTDHAGFGACKFHGGASPSGKKFAAKQALQYAAVTAGIPRDVDPAQGLMEEIARTAGRIDWYTERIRVLDPENVIRGPASQKRIEISRAAGDGAGTATIQTTTITEVTAAIHLFVELEFRERKHYAMVCKLALDAGVAERQIRWAESLGVMLGELVRGVFDDMGLRGAEREAALDSAQRRFALLPGGKSLNTAPAAESGPDDDDDGLDDDDEAEQTG